MQRFSNDHDFEMDLGPVELNCRRKPIDTMYDHWALHLLGCGPLAVLLGFFSAALLGKIGIIETGPKNYTPLWILIPLMWIVSFAAAMVIRRACWLRKMCARHRHGLRWDGRAYRDDEIAGLLPFGVPGAIRSTFPWLSRLFSILQPRAGAIQRATDRASVTLVLADGRQHVLFCPWKYFEDQDLAALLATLRAQRPGWFPPEHWQ